MMSEVRSARAALGWSQPDLAAQAGVSQVALARLEAGMVTPRYQTIARLIRALESAGVHIIDNDPAGGYTLRVEPSAFVETNREEQQGNDCDAKDKPSE